MKVTETELKGCFIIEPMVFFDDRGLFFETYQKEKLEQALGHPLNFVQNNQSVSKKGVLRGLHYQKGEHAQAKLVQVVNGEVLDVIVDLRKESPTFGQHITIQLSDKNKKLIFIPRGMAHGFLVHSEEAVFSYQCDNYYNKDSEAGIIFNDPDLAIEWGGPHEEIVLSAKDNRTAYIQNDVPMIRILVTGSKGQLGQSLQEIAGKYKTLQFDFVGSNTLDITDSAEVETFFTAGNFDFCINCAAYTNVNGAEEHPEDAFAVNAEGAKNLALACQNHNVILIHISTDYVFDGEKETGYFPTDKTNPINEYGKSKLKGEHYIQEILERYFIVRTSWLYSKYGNNFYKTILKKARAGEDLHITDEQTGCPTNAENLATYILDLVHLKNDDYGILHFTDGESMTWYDFANRILQEHKIDIRVVATRYQTITKRPKYSVLRSFPR